MAFPSPSTLITNDGTVRPTLFVVAAALWVGGLLLFWVSPTQAQDTDGRLEGVVRSSTSGTPVSDANVVLRAADRGAVTDADGRFTVSNLSPDVYRLQITHIQYATYEDTVRVKPGTRKLQITLSPATRSLEKVTVADTTRRMFEDGETASQVSMTPEAIQTLPQIGQVDLFRSIQRLPAVSGTNEHSAGLYVRGSTPGQTLVQFDGIPIYRADHFYGFFSAFNTPAIQDATLYKSAYPVKYGGRTGSVLSIEGRPGSNEFGGQMNVNLLSASGIVEGPLGEWGSFLISGRRSYTDVFESGVYDNIQNTVTDTNDPNGEEGALPETADDINNAQLTSVEPTFTFYDVSAKVSIVPTDVDRFAATVYGSQDDLQKSSSTTRRLTGSTLLEQDGQSTTDWGNRGGSVQWERQWGPNVRTRLQAAYSRYESDLSRTETGDLRNATADTSLSETVESRTERNRIQNALIRLDATWNGAGHALSAGLEGKRPSVEAEFRQSDSLRLANLQAPPDTTSLLDRQNASHIIGGYVRDEWQITPEWELEGGLRASYSNHTESVHWTPRLAVRYAPTSALTVEGAVGQYHQFAKRALNENVTERTRDFWILANGDDIPVSRGRHATLGSEYQTGKWVARLDAFVEVANGVSEFTSRFDQTGAQNDSRFFSGTSRARGIEVLLKRTQGRHTGWVSYTLSRVQRDFSEFNDGEPFPALHDQRHELKTTYQLSLGRWDFSATWTYGSGTPYTRPSDQYSLELVDGSSQTFLHVRNKNGRRLPAYHRLDTSVHYQRPIGSFKIDVGISVFNLYNRQNIWYKEFDVSETPVLVRDVEYTGFTPNVSLKVKF